MVVKQADYVDASRKRLRVVLSHMVVKLRWLRALSLCRLRVVLSHMVVKHQDGR